MPEEAKLPKSRGLKECLDLRLHYYIQPHIDHKVKKKL